MRLTIAVDNLRHEIDSTDPETLARWILEIIGRFAWTPATYAYFQVYPSFTLNRETGEYAPDWVADSRVLGEFTQFRGPRDLLIALADQIERQEELAERDRQRADSDPSSP